MKKINAQARAKQLKSEKRAKIAVTVLMCLVAVTTAAVIAVSTFTDIFKQEPEVKAVALVLSQAEQQELEAQLSKLVPLAENGFDAATMGAEELLSYIKPYSSDGLYAAYGYETAVLSAVADPAMRFKDEAGNYKYCKVTKSRVDNILRQFEINIDHTVNVKDVYYYDGYYYFAAKDEGVHSSELTAAITASKRIQDGRYYMTCELGDKTVYIIAGKSQQEDTVWKIHRISLSPIFDQLGIMIKESENSLFDYDIKTKVIEGKTQQGNVYCRYVLKYPVFYGKTAGETEANRFYQSVLSYYTQLADDCTEQYKKYIAAGGKESALPLELSYEAQVTYAAGDYIGVTNEISETQPVNENPDEEGADNEPVVPVKKTMECYIFDTETGAYVTKDSIIGKDYQLLEELLYRIYCGYEYEALLSEDAQDTADVPEDEDDLGEAIYASANTISKDGYLFCYVDENACRQDVVIPFTANIFEVEIG